jgi:hypothetical protein
VPVAAPTIVNASETRGRWRGPESDPVTCGMRARVLALGGKEKTGGGSWDLLALPLSTSAGRARERKQRVIRKIIRITFA